MSTAHGSVTNLPAREATRLARAVLIALLAVGAACGGGRPTAPSPIVTPPSEPAAPPAPPPPAPVLGVTRILAFGDSMTEGTTSTPLPFAALTAGKSESYPFKLQALMNARYTDQAIVVLNAGRAGEMASGSSTYDRFRGSLSEAKPDVLLLMEGANDLNAVAPSVSATVNAIEEMVKEARRRNIAVMLASLPPQRPGPGTKTTTPAALSRFNSDLRTMAGNKDAEFLDVGTLLPVSAIGQDGLHPTEAGYELLAQIFMDAIKAKFEK